jgi:hypothetical protein
MREALSRTARFALGWRAVAAAVEPFAVTTLRSPEMIISVINST